MRPAILGFVTGVILMLLAAGIYQHEVITASADDLEYHFSKYIFSQPEFPWGDLVQGRVVRRALFPVKIAVTFYDVHYTEVTQADKPGRYGAVVRIGLNGGVVAYRFATLYRTPVNVHWWEAPIPITAPIPPAAGIDPAVLGIQAPEIGEAIKDDFFADHGDNPNLAILLAGLSETSPSDPPAVERTNVAARDAAWWFGLRQKLGLAEHYPCLVDLPHDYDADPAKRWPLILFLHAGDQRGNNLQPVRTTGLPGAVAEGRQVPAIVISPQCPWGEDWNRLVLGQLLDEVSAKYRVDPDRIYVTGTSLGGDATWDLGMSYPERFAAIIPIAGEGDFADAARIKDIPTWAFQGEKDEIIPTSETINMVNAVRQAGGHPHLTLLSGRGHDVWGQVYATDALYTWLFAQKRGQPEVVTPGVPVP
jgi:acetyl esterase/lipase